MIQILNSGAVNAPKFRIITLGEAQAEMLKNLADPRIFIRYTRRGSEMLFDRLVRVPRTSAPKDAVAVLHFSRSGSTVLGSLLDQHPALYWDGEAMGRGGTMRELFRRLQGVGARQGIERLPWLMRYAGERSYVLSIVGLYGRTPEALITELEALGFSRFVLLRRENLLRRRLSTVIAARTRQWHFRGSHKPVLTPIELKTEMPLPAFLRMHQENYRRMAAALAGRPTLELSYEADIAPSPIGAYGKVCGFLQIEPRPVVVEYNRINDFPLRDLLINYDEVAAALHGTEFGWMLEE